MTQREYLAIYNAMKYKYTNNIFKDLPGMLSAYLLAYPDKFELYFNPLITIEDVLEYIAKHYNGEESTLMDIIIEFIEGPNG